MAEIVNPTYKYAHDLYLELVKNSREVDPSELLEFGYPQEDRTAVRLFSGIIHRSAEAIGLSTSQAFKAMGVLNAMRCTTKLKTGGPFSPSYYLLHYEPTQKDWDNWKEASSKTGRRIAPSLIEVLSRDLLELRTRVGELEIEVRNLKNKGEAIVGHNVQRGEALPKM